MGKSAPQPRECFYLFWTRCHALKQRKGTELVQVTNHIFTFVCLTLSLRVKLPQRKSQIQTGITFIITSSASRAAKEWRRIPDRRSVLALVALSSSPGQHRCLRVRAAPRPHLRGVSACREPAPTAAPRLSRTRGQKPLSIARTRPRFLSRQGRCCGAQSPRPCSVHSPWRGQGPLSRPPMQPSSPRRSPTGDSGSAREFPAHRPAVAAPPEAAVPADGGRWRPGPLTTRSSAAMLPDTPRGEGAAAGAHGNCSSVPRGLMGTVVLFRVVSREL